MFPDVSHPLIHYPQRFRRLIERRAWPRVGKPNHLIIGVAHRLDHPLSADEGLAAVVHVEPLLEIVTPVDDRNLDAAAKHHARAVRGVMAMRCPWARGAGVSPSSGLRFMFLELHGSQVPCRNGAQCPCGGRRRVLAVVTDGRTAEDSMFYLSVKTYPLLRQPSHHQRGS